MSTHSFGVLFWHKLEVHHKLIAQHVIARPPIDTPRPYHVGSLRATSVVFMIILFTAIHECAHWATTVVRTLGRCLSVWHVGEQRVVTWGIRSHTSCSALFFTMADQLRADAIGPGARQQ